MNTPIPGLRPIVHDARSATKVQLSVAPGDTLIVSDEIAEQLIASSPQFKRSGSAAEMQPAAAPAAAGVPQRPAMNRSRDQWAQYADAIGVEFDDSAGRDEIIEAVRQAESGDD